MRKIIDELMEKKDEEALKKENEQVERKARLSELEEKNKGIKRKLLHPVNSVNDGKEIKKLKEDIAAFEKAKEDKKILLISGGLICVCMIMIFASGLFHKTPNNETNETLVAMTASEAKTENAIEPTTEVPAVIEDEQASIDSSVDSSTGFTGTRTDDSEENDNVVVNETTEQVAEEIDTVDEPVEQGLLISEFKVYYKPDYVHVNNDSIYLGNDEGLTLTIETDNEIDDIDDIDDLVFDYDTSLLNLYVQDSDYQDGKTTIIVYVTALEECNTDLIITTEYEIEKMGDNAQYFLFGIRKLDSSEGKVVYVTPTGEKYHYRADCAGENAIKTTYHDAEMIELEPCGKCVN